MNAFAIPVSVIGPGSQPEDDELRYLDMPRDMPTFAMPSVPETAPPDAMREARDVLAAFHAMLERWDPAVTGDHPRLDLADVSADARTVLNEVLGEGEVAIQVGGAQPWRIQESVFTGLWRLYAVDAGGVVADLLEAAGVPQIALSVARTASALRLPPVAIPPGAMNSPSLLHEIEGQLATRGAGDPPHVLNLTLFPMSADDHLVLERALPVGPVAMISRGFGNCRITSTGARDVWRVQYFNSMNTLILNTIEIVDVPEVAMAAAEDLLDSRARLGELIQWMGESCTA